MAYTDAMDAALKALAEPRRRRSSGWCGAEELPAAQIAAQFDDVTRSAVSQHLGVLREAELVIERRDGTRRLYRADHAQMDRLRQFLDEYWTGKPATSAIPGRIGRTRERNH